MKLEQRLAGSVERCRVHKPSLNEHKDKMTDSVIFFSSTAIQALRPEITFLTSQFDTENKQSQCLKVSCIPNCSPVDTFPRLPNKRKQPFRNVKNIDESGTTMSKTRHPAERHTQPRLYSAKVGKAVQSCLSVVAQEDKNITSWLRYLTESDLPKQRSRFAEFV